MLKKLFLIIITVTTISCGQSGWWWSDEGVFIAPRSLNAEGDSFKINLTVPDFVSGDTLKLYYNDNLIETFFEDTTTVLGLADNTQYCYVLKRQTFQGLSSGTQACATTIDTIIVGALSTPVLLASKIPYPALVFFIVNAVSAWVELYPTLKAKLEVKTVVSVGAPSTNLCPLIETFCKTKLVSNTSVEPIYKAPA